MLRETCLLIKSKSIYKDYLSNYMDLLKSKFDKLKKEDNYINTSAIINLLLYLEIILVNMNKESELIKRFFEKTFNSILNLIKEVKNEKSKRAFYEILNGIFEEKLLFTGQNPDLAILIVNKQNELHTFYVDTIYSFNKDSYQKIVKNLINLDLTYKDIFDKNYSSLPVEQRSMYKMNLVQSVIRLIFSPQKYDFCTDKNFCEYTILQKIIDNDIRECLKIYGDNYKTLFRKESFKDDIIKYLFFMFGNILIFKSLYCPLQKLKNKYKKPDQIITIEDFDDFFEDMTNGIIKYIPYILKIILKFIDMSARKYFKIEANNYIPLQTALFFNYILNPRIQEIHSIEPLKSNVAKTINKLLVNICYNKYFEQNDKLNIFNSSLDKYNRSLKNLFEKHIICLTINNNKVKEEIKTFFKDETKFPKYPKFAFNWDCEIIDININKKTNNIFEFVNK